MEVNVNELIYLYHTRDDSALESLIALFRPLVRKVYNELPRLHTGIEVQDFFSQADLTLITCLERYRADLNYAFSTYYINSVQRLGLDLLRYVTRGSRKSHDHALSLDYEYIEGAGSFVSLLEDVRSNTSEQAMAMLVMENLENVAREMYGEEGRRILELRQQAYTRTEIARNLNTTVGRVSYILKRIRAQADKRGLI